MKKLKKPFEIFQIYVDIDITDYYFDEYNDTERSAICEYFENNLTTSDDGRQILTVTSHGVDSSLLRYFGDKSSIDNRNKIIDSKFCNWDVDKPKQRFLDLIGYPNYCLMTPEGPACRLTNDNEEKAKYEKWNKIWGEDGIDTPLDIYVSNYLMTQEINKDILTKIYYDEKKDELFVRLLFDQFNLTFIDNDVPAPLKNIYDVAFSSSECPNS